MIADLFLRRIEQQYIQLYEVLYRTPMHNLSLAAQTLQWPYQQTYYVYNHLEQVITIEEQALATPTQVTCQLIEQSIGFRTLANSLLVHSNLTDLLKALDCSVTTLKRRLSYLKTYLKQAKLKYSVNSNRLVGDERQIRLFYWYIYNFVNQQVPLPGKTENLVELIDQQLFSGKHDQMHTLKLTNLLAISFRRLSEQHWLKTDYTDPTIPESLVTTCAVQLHVPTTVILQELSWIKYILAASPYVVVNEAMLNMADVQLAAKLGTLLQNKANRHHEFYLASLIAYSRHEELPIMSDNDHVPLESGYLAQIQGLVEQAQTADYAMTKPEIVTLIMQNIVPSLTVMVPKIKLSLYLTDQLPREQVDWIMTALNNILSETVALSADLQSADLLILTEPPVEPIAATQQVYYWSLGQSQNLNVMNLLTLLNKRLLGLKICK
ncbi:helix-turn-helix domain-containing protein [Loigolactobacillus jiayinensis]|uniref:Helix-turn-helix domain-containing protein n=1 Tax=Loigolactobacillus jiayinensis TaxID=2486016 RepID=A0ABW1REI2_9LACO|nr:helix-turn-helix domain-containing protein [Loigolactobacillus jiayinensis]